MAASFWLCDVWPVLGGPRGVARFGGRAGRLRRVINAVPADSSGTTPPNRIPLRSDLSGPPPR